jgi:DNA polymerase III sliding clamp (beta) subunit (PCNA family)
MKVSREDILTQLESVIPGLAQREILEQSDCFVFKNGEVMTYNEEVACRIATPLDITGAIKAPAFLTLLRKLEEATIDISQDSKGLIIKGKRKRATLKMEAEALLPIEEIETPDEWRPLPADFQEAISIVKETAGSNETKFHLTCIHLHPKWVESCDNHQATRYKCKTGVKESVLVRKTAIQSVIDLGAEEVSETKTWIHFRNANGLMVSCRRYADESYMDLIPILTVDGSPLVIPKALIEAADKAAVFSKENKDNDQVEISLKPGKLKITGKGNFGWYEEFVSARYDGDSLFFLISPELLQRICNEDGKCEVTDTRLKISNSKFVYVTCLGLQDNGEG